MSLQNRFLYDLPDYYDIAFSHDPNPEIDLFVQFFQRHVPFKVKKILEPCCGTGRFLVSLPLRGFRVTGYDSNFRMVDYALNKIRLANLLGKAEAHIMDLRTATFPRKFDAAINAINSLGYLLTDEDILAHFRVTGEVLKLNGAYIVQITCAAERLDPGNKQEWTKERLGITVKTAWSTLSQDFEKKLSTQVCRMEIKDRDRQFTFEDVQTLRLWLFDDIKQLIADSGRFQLAAVYTDEGREVPLETRITGELGNLYYVLKVL